MQEYFGDSAKKYLQPTDKFFTLFPALDRVIPQAPNGAKLCDLACGTGDLYDFVVYKGYEYVGIDISGDMLQRARESHKQGLFIEGDVTKPISNVKQKFHVVLCNMLTPSLSRIEDFNSVFMVASGMLTENGHLIVSAGHPCFDGYMGKKFFGREDIETEYMGYFASAHNYKVHRKFKDNSFIFSDHHWTLNNYLEAAKVAGLYLSSIDECPLVGEVPKDILDKVNSKGTPSFIVFDFAHYPDKTSL